MADDPNATNPNPPVQDLGAPARVVTSSGGEKNPTLEEQSAEQDRLAAEKAAKEGGETPEQKAAREAAEAKAKEPGEEGEKKPAAAEGPVDLKGTVFEGLSPDMQGKIAPFAAAYETNGTLTDAEITEAAHATGMSEAVVKQFMAGAEARAADVTADAAPVLSMFGGAEGYKAFQAWSNDEGTLTEAETRTINKALGIGPDGKLIEGAKPDYEMAAQLMQAPLARFKEAGGGPAPRDVTAGKTAGQGPGAQPGDTYANWAQVTKDMAKPEYRKDAAFRDQVQQKIARSGTLA